MKIVYGYMTIIFISKCYSSIIIIKDIINGKKYICKMILAHIYQIFDNNFKINYFIDEDNIKVIKFKEYKDCVDLIEIEDLNSVI